MKPEDVDLLIYHGHCSDGLGAALAAYRYFEPSGCNAAGRVVEYYAASFLAPPPITAGKHVLLCDFAYSLPIMESIRATAADVLILDHHQSNEEALATFEPRMKHFDRTRSGAALAWQWFFPERPLPLFIRYIEDNDLWIRALPDTDSLRAYYQRLPFTFEAYRPLLDDAEVMRALPFARVLERSDQYWIQTFVAAATCVRVEIDGRVYDIAHCNAPVLKSEVGDALLDRFPAADLAAVFSLEGDWARFSLRSRDDRADTLPIARFYGGGGHRNASGCMRRYSITLGNVVSAQ